MGYGEKHEMQGLNEILEGCLGEMQQLEAETAEFEKRIAEMEGNPCRRTRRTWARPRLRCLLQYRLRLASRPAHPCSQNAEQLHNVAEFFRCMIPVSRARSRRGGRGQEGHRRARPQEQ